MATRRTILSGIGLLAAGGLGASTVIGTATRPSSTFKK